jgi:prepilin-type N-terminal cleavage/methylation domain-containing protein
MPMNTGSRSGPKVCGFTLVELLTVIAIMAVLISLVVGAFTGVKNHVARKNTILMFRALEGALKRYYDDWGAYPWFDQDVKCTVSDPTNLKGPTDVTIMDKADITLLPPSTSTGLKATALLYAALNVRVRSGPYLPGSSTQCIEKKITEGGRTFTFMAYADGWGRPIMYGPPGKNKDPVPNTTLLVDMDSTRSTMPRLESRGSDEFNKEDNIKNYDYEDYLEDIRMYTGQ